MMGNVALGREIKGYHYAYSPEGACVIECDEPAVGMVTVTWKSGDLAGKNSSIVCTRDVFEIAIKSYLAEFNAAQK
jgi:hypothetical protein